MKAIFIAAGMAYVQTTELQERAAETAKAVSDKAEADQRHREAIEQVKTFRSVIPSQSDVVAGEEGERNARRGAPVEEENAGVDAPPGSGDSLGPGGRVDRGCVHGERLAHACRRDRTG